MLLLSVQNWPTFDIGNNHCVEAVLNEERELLVRLMTKNCECAITESCLEQVLLEGIL
jgi:hypothetical protein